MSQQYYDKFALSQSSLKDWKDKSPKQWYDNWIAKTTPRRTSTSIEFGSLVDNLCFTPEKFDKRFIVATVAKPSDTIVNILTQLYDGLLQLNKNIDELNAKPDNKVMVPHRLLTISDNKEVVLKLCVNNDYYASKPEQGYNKIVKEGADYFEFLKSVGKRTVITEMQKAAALELKNILFTDPVSAPFFVPKKGCEVLFQVQMFVEHEVTGFENIEMIPLKGMLDILHFNHKTKQVREVDLKCTSDAFKFNDPKGGPVKMFDYPAQHSFYDYLIPKFLETYKDGAYADYTVCNPLNVVIDDENKLPLLYEYNKKDLDVKRFGIENTSLTGWEDTINEIAWHLDNNDWTRPMQHIKNGRLFINVFNKR